MYQSIPDSICRIADFQRNLNLRVTLPQAMKHARVAQASSSQHLIVPADIQSLWQLVLKDSAVHQSVQFLNQFILIFLEFSSRILL